MPNVQANTIPKKMAANKPDIFGSQKQNLKRFAESRAFRSDNRKGKIS